MFLLLLTLLSASEFSHFPKGRLRPLQECRKVLTQQIHDELRELAKNWIDLDLKTSTNFRELLHAFKQTEDFHNLVKLAERCAVLVFVLTLASIPAVDYFDGRKAALKQIDFINYLRERTSKKFWRKSAREGWKFASLDFLKTYNFLRNQSCYLSSVKFYVYDLWLDIGGVKNRSLTRGPAFCQFGQWGVEVLVPEYFTQCRTANPKEADYFIVPWYTWCDRGYFQFKASGRGEVAEIHKRILEENLLQYWNLHFPGGGRNHIFLFPDQGQNFFTDWAEYVPRSIFLMTEGYPTGCGFRCYVPWKDIVIPGHTDYFRWELMKKYNLPTVERDLLFNFHGRHYYNHEFYLNCKVRKRIVDVFQNYGPRVSVGGFVADYFEIMGASQFCLIPEGTSPWTNHLYEAFFAGCIPVILSDRFEVPFEEFLDWSKFSIKWPMDKVNSELYNYLDSIPQETRQKMKKQVDLHACWFDYHRVLEKRRCSPYLGIVKILEKRKLVKSLNSGSTWWTKNSGQNSLFWNFTR